MRNFITVFVILAFGAPVLAPAARDGFMKPAQTAYEQNMQISSDSVPEMQCAEHDQSQGDGTACERFSYIMMKLPKGILNRQYNHNQQFVRQHLQERLLVVYGLLSKPVPKPPPYLI